MTTIGYHFLSDSMSY